MAVFQPPAQSTTPGAGWALIIIGALAVLAGIVALVFPGLTILSLVLLFGWFAVVAGVVEVIHAFTGGRSTEGRIVLALWGLATIAVGIIALLLPGVTVGVMVILMAAYFLITGVAQIVAAFRGHAHGWLLFWGIIGIIAAIAAIVYPGAAALTLAIIFGVYAVLGGITALAAGIHILRRPAQPSVRARNIA